jgi:hypothetical protein
VKNDDFLCPLGVKNICVSGHPTDPRKFPSKKKLGSAIFYDDPIVYVLGFARYQNTTTRLSSFDQCRFTAGKEE